MKLKLTLVLGLLAAGACASFALADDGNRGKHDGHGDRCRPVRISGTVAPQTLAVTVDRASAKALVAAGSTLNLAVGAAGQTVRLKAEACSTGTAGAVTLTVKRIELRPEKAKTPTTTTAPAETTTTTTAP